MTLKPSPARRAKETGKPVVPVRCEGFRGVSQSLGHHIANDTVRDWVLPKADEYRKLPEGFEPRPLRCQHHR
jgi:nitrogenase molybdenum-iron protein alpha chain